MSNKIPLPKLQDYGLNGATGFLPVELPVTKLSDPYYEKWESVVSKLPSLLLSRRIRDIVDKLPILEVKKSLLADNAELRRAYSVLCFITNAYVWGYDEPSEILPECIAQPLLAISDKLGLPPLATYASLVLFNYQPIIEDSELVEDVMDLQNLTTINTFTGGMDESWFYLVSVFFEKTGGQCLKAGLEAIQAARDGNSEKVRSLLESIAQGIDQLGSLLMRMEEMCDPHVFYYRIRPYLAGWKNMADAGLPNGIKYGPSGPYQQYAGGSNAQSSLIQALDILLGVEHFAMGHKKPQQDAISAKSASNSFINDMRMYMPREHREFLVHLQQVSNVRDYVTNHRSNENLTLAFDACLAMLKSFRDKHIQIVSRYVILQANKKPLSGGKSKTLRSGLSKGQGKKEQKGTGGTSLIPFLKQCRDETGSVAASDWGKKMLSTGVLQVQSSSSIVGIRKQREEDQCTEQNSKRAKVGLAGDWSSFDDDDEIVSRSSGHW
ncbi:LANO_0F12684g1_1 [Lachancea nothofagi CBS 11611]|uniref:Indoleamine 2,3-dioxygenase n=1 Tax=Lachancea nothofagi CBS 11611 TaxID=1266666 RepID=A0A1G4KBH2_9SACH|nr:LANO_0F12684g1_1 [Lachancea nothofagi CBS 11611]